LTIASLAFPFGSALAQENGSLTYSKDDIFTGVSLLRLKPGSNIDNTNLAGWQLTGTHYFTRRLGFTAEISGNYGTVNLPQNGTGITSVDVNQHSFLFGPQVRMLHWKRLRTSLRATAGVARANTSVDSSLAGPRDVGVYLTNTKFAAAIGSAIDFQITPRLYYRIQPNIFLTPFAPTPDRNLPLPLGLVYRFGQQ